MTQYRVYWLDDANHIRGAANIECNDDNHAQRLAAVCLELWPAVEIWCGRTMVTRLCAHEARPAAEPPGDGLRGYTAEHWRERAEEARVIAEGLRDSEAREVLLRAAAEAERHAGRQSV